MKTANLYAPSDEADKGGASTVARVVIVSPKSPGTDPRHCPAADDPDEAGLTAPGTAAAGHAWLD